MIKKTTICYFSPTGGTEKVAKRLGNEITKSLQEADKYLNEKITVSEIDFTKPQTRKERFEFDDKDLVVVASPVYAGRVPNKIAPDFKASIKGKKTKCVILCCYGNRSYGGALTELGLIMQENGFEIIAAAAVVAQHPFSDLVGAGRPSDSDFRDVSGFAEAVSRKVIKGGNINLPSDTEIPPYYTPLKEDNTPAKFLKAKPVTEEELCDNCRTCAKACPVGSIDIKDCTKTTGICIKCQACIKVCPNGAKAFADEDFLSHVRMLEMNYTKPNKNSFILPND